MEHVDEYCEMRDTDNAELEAIYAEIGYEEITSTLALSA